MWLIKGFKLFLLFANVDLLVVVVSIFVVLVDCWLLSVNDWPSCVADVVAVACLVDCVMPLTPLLSLLLVTMKR